MVFSSVEFTIGHVNSFEKIMVIYDFGGFIQFFSVPNVLMGKLQLENGHNKTKVREWLIGSVRLIQARSGMV